MKDNRGTYSIDWESDDTLKKVKGNFDFLNKGCSHKLDVEQNNVVARKLTKIVELDMNVEIIQMCKLPVEKM